MYARVRHVLRPWATKQARAGLPLVARLAQPTGYRALDETQGALAYALSFVVAVETYVVGLPLLCWNGSRATMRSLITVLAVALWIGNALKDLVASPRPAQFAQTSALRPPSPSATTPASPRSPRGTTARRKSGATAPSLSSSSSGVTTRSASGGSLTSTSSSPNVAAAAGAPAPLETPDRHFMTPSTSLEFGFPSSHASNHVVAAYMLLEGSPLANRWAWTLGTTALVAWSRAHKRVHTPFDLVGGTLVGAIPVLAWEYTNVREMVAAHVGAGLPPALRLAKLVLAIALSHVAYPEPPPPAQTPSKDLAMRMVAAAAGVWFGDANVAGGAAALPPATRAHFAARCAVGFPIMAVVYFAADAVAKALRKLALDASKPTPDWFLTTKVTLKYGGLGWACTELVPLAFVSLGV